MKLIAMLGLRSNPLAAYREETFEADDYETAYRHVMDSLVEDGRLLSVVDHKWPDHDLYPRP